MIWTFWEAIVFLSIFHWMINIFHYSAIQLFCFFREFTIDDILFKSHHQNLEMWNLVWTKTIQKWKFIHDLCLNKSNFTMWNNRLNNIIPMNMLLRSFFSSNWCLWLLLLWWTNGTHSNSVSTSEISSLKFLLRSRILENKANNARSLNTLSI